MANAKQVSDTKKKRNTYVDFKLIDFIGVLC